MHTSQFKPSAQAEQIMRDGRILGPEETPQQMIERVVETAFSAEGVSFGYEASETRRAAQSFGELCDNGAIVMSTPVLTNAGRYEDKPLTACTMPPVDLRGDLRSVKQTVDTLHQQGMGTGFNLSDTQDPVAMLNYLNSAAVEGANSGNEDRPVGNMAIISVRHPKIREFIDAKRTSISDGSSWKFNISIDADGAFMRAVENGDAITLEDGSRVDASALFSQICSAAHECADPGLIFLDRMNYRNPTPGLGEYQTTAPCAEVGLAPGETCQFGYINLGKFVETDQAGQATLDFDKLANTARLMTRVLDNCLELSFGRYTVAESGSIMHLKRKIGIGICGLADMLVQAGLPYDSPEAVKMAQDAIAWINYQSKLASIELGNRRGGAGAMQLFNFGLGAPVNKHLENPGLVNRLFGDVDTRMVTGAMWQALDEQIRSGRTLRNVTTTALPPTGRSSLVIDASTGVEPYFTLTNSRGELHQPIVDFLRAAGVSYDQLQQINEGTNMPTDADRKIQRVLETATAISAFGHLNMAAGVQTVIDEAVSKTINMPEASSVTDIEEIYYSAWQQGMSGITVYRQGTHSLQPKKL